MLLADRSKQQWSIFSRIPKTRALQSIARPCKSWAKTLGHMKFAFLNRKFDPLQSLHKNVRYRTFSHCALLLRTRFFRRISLPTARCGFNTFFALFFTLFFLFCQLLNGEDCIHFKCLTSSLWKVIKLEPFGYTRFWRIEFDWFFLWLCVDLRWNSRIFFAVHVWVPVPRQSGLYIKVPSCAMRLGGSGHLPNAFRCTCLPSVWKSLVRKRLAARTPPD